MPSHISLVTSAPDATLQSPADRSVGDALGGGNARRAALTLAVALLLTATGFLTGGGVDEVIAGWRNTWTEIGLDALGAIAVGAGLFLRPPGRRFGWGCVALMAMMFALEAASIAWSVAPDSSWLASGQMLAYVAVFAGATALARPLHRDWPALLGGFVVWAAAICAWSLLAKVFPSTLAPGNQFGRLQAPFGYWNALASVAAMGIPCCLWLGARREGGRRLAALSVPALALLVAVLVLSYSRSGDAAAVAAAAAWLIVVPLRLRAVVVAALGALGGGVISLWGLTHHGISGNGVPTATAAHSGHIFGIVIVVVLVLVTIGGVAVTEAMDRAAVAPRTRRRAASGLLAGLIVLVAVAVVGVATSSRGLTGEISHGWHELTNPQAAVSETSASRVLQFGSSRPTYWHEALQVGDHAVFKGVGEAGFSVARLLYPGNPGTVFQAHSYVFETYADLGVLGLAVTAALLLSWLWATGRTLVPRRRAATLTPAAQAERIGLCSLAALVLAFGIQSTLDWTWFFAGLAVPALLAAGWLAGRGPVSEPVPARAAGGSVLDRVGALAAIPLLVALVLVGGWMTWRPLHSAELVNQAEVTGEYSAALAAQRADPLSVFPYELLASFDQRASPARAQGELEQATREQPHNPASWEALAEFLFGRHEWRAALGPAARVKALDTTGDPTQTANDALITAIFTHLTPPASAAPGAASSTGGKSSTSTTSTTSATSSSSSGG